MDVSRKKLLSKLGLKDQISLSELCNSLKDMLGEELISVILYGNATVHDYHPQAGDKNILIVIRNINTDGLRKLIRPVYKVQRLGFDTTFMTQENLIASTDVFPIKYQSIKESHILLHGLNVMEKLEINPVHIRLICELDLRNLSQDLSKHFLDNRGTQLKDKLTSVITDTIETLRVAVLLKTNKMPVWNDTVEEVTKTFKVEGDILNEIMEVHHGKISLNKRRTEDLYDRFLSFVHQMVNLVDQM